MGMLQEFKAFAMRGNVVDMAVGIIIGAAFGKIVSSLVADVVTPPLGMLIGGIDFSSLGFTLKDAVLKPDGTILTPAVAINYGKFIQATVDFIIVAFAIFMMIKLMNKLKKHEEAKPAPAPAPTPTENLLGEIRDILKKG
jgi:large conductance mechanosensitive channel